MPKCRRSCAANSSGSSRGRSSFLLPRVTTNFVSVSVNLPSEVSRVHKRLFLKWDLGDVCCQRHLGTKSPSFRGIRLNLYWGSHRPFPFVLRDNKVQRSLRVKRYSFPWSVCGRGMSSRFGFVNESPNPTSASQGSLSFTSRVI